MDNVWSWSLKQCKKKIFFDKNRWKYSMSIVDRFDPKKMDVEWMLYKTGIF